MVKVQETVQKDLRKKLYLDWNIFNKLEHIDDQEVGGKEHYLCIYLLARRNLFITPYSNAHINDLLRGYLKDPSYTPGHLANISLLTGNLCLTQYWGETGVRWHYRSPSDYLDSTIEESEETADSFSSLFATIGDPFAEEVFEIQKTMLRLKPVPSEFKQLYTFNPIFNSMYPRTKIHMNHLALCDDIYDFAFKIKHDFTLYRHFRKFMLETKNKFPQYRDLFNSADNKVIGKPKYLTWDEMWDDLEPKFKGTSNPRYDQIMNLFTTTDLKGYRADERFANLIDDALHCFYAAHCDYFITLDKRCYDKAKLVYQKLNIPTKVFTPEEFYLDLRNQQQPL